MLNQITERVPERFSEAMVDTPEVGTAHVTDPEPASVINQIELVYCIECITKMVVNAAQVVSEKADLFDEL
jgi:hypothetical protein